MHACKPEEPLSGQGQENAHSTHPSFFQFNADYLDRLRAGDSETAQHFYSYFSRYLTQRLRRHAHAAFSIEDIQQDTFTRVLRAIRNPGSIKCPERFGGFVMGVCQNVLHEYLRKERWESSEGNDHHRDNRPDPETLASTSQLHERVMQTLLTMSTADRQLLCLAFIDEKSHEEISRELNVKRSYARVLLFRARSRFRLRLAEVIGPHRKRIADGPAIVSERCLKRQLCFSVV